MRREISTLLAVLLLLSTVQITESEGTIRVLVDESRVYSVDEFTQMVMVQLLEYSKDIDWRISFENHDQEWGLGDAGKKLDEIASMHITKSRKITYASLKNYDILVIASFEESYSSEEADAIRRFVENGGGLLFMAAPDSPNNSVCLIFDVLFGSTSAVIADKEAEDFASIYQFYIDDISDHTVTKDVEKIALNVGIPISSYESGKVLARTSRVSWADEIDLFTDGKKRDYEDEGPFDILLAMDNVGKGRAVFFASSSSFYNWVIATPDHQNLTLLENSVKWLGEPGGPYKQYKVVNEQANQKLSNAQSLFKDHKFSQAISAFEETISIFKESSGIYTNPEATEGIAEAESYIEMCEIGIDADQIFQNATSLYESRKYQRAIDKFEKAMELYEQIEYIEMVQECATKVEESKMWIALREKATRELDDAETALAIAPSTFDPSGYHHAKTLFEKAKSTWKEYDDPVNTEICQEKIDICNEEIATINKNRMMLILGTGGGIVAFVVIIVVIMRRLKSRSKKELEETEVKPAKKTLRNLQRVLAEQYVKGEISKEKYEKLTSAIEEK